MNGKYVSYLRVSTARQGRSGLGLDAQRSAVSAYLNGGRWKLLAEYVEIESGKRCDRPQLATAMARCKLTGAILLIAKMDRLSRNAAFLLSLRDAGVEFLAVDMPTASRLSVGIMAVVAEAEGEAISTRTKAALAIARSRGTVLGGYRGGPGPDARLATIARQKAADDFASRVGPMILELRQQGFSLRWIATDLGKQGIQTARGGKWTATAVSNAMARL